MAENTKGQNPSRDRENEDLTADQLRSNTGVGRDANERAGTTELDEKSSGVGRTNSGRGLTSKDGLTGSDYDGQVTD